MAYEAARAVPQDVLWRRERIDMRLNQRYTLPAMS